MKTKVTEVTPAVLLTSIKVCAAAREPLFIWGSPGTGKSDIVRAAAADLNAHVIDVRASQWDAVDTRGVPYVDEQPANPRKLSKAAGGNGALTRFTRWAVPAVFPTEAEAAKHNLIFLFLDELNSAMGAVQAALYQLILDRRLGDYVLPDNVVVIAAGNEETDRAVTHRMSTALAGRFIHQRLLVDAKAWESWAISADLHVGVISFMRWRPELLHKWDPKSDSKAQPTPRTWAKASKLIDAIEQMKPGPQVEASLLAGAVGDGAGAELFGFLKIFRELPDPDAVLMDPMNAVVPEDPATKYALCGALAERASTSNMGRLLQYAERFEKSSGGPEFMTLLVRIAAIRHPEVQSTKAFIKWASDHSDVLC